MEADERCAAVFKCVSVLSSFTLPLCKGQGHKFCWNKPGRGQKCNILKVLMRKVVRCQTGSRVCGGPHSLSTEISLLTHWHIRARLQLVCEFLTKEGTVPTERH